MPLSKHRATRLSRFDRLCTKGELKRKTVGRQPYVITKSILDSLSEGPTITDGLTILTSEELDIRRKLMRD